MATSVLPLVTGSLTRLAQFYTTSEKHYDGTIRFGFATDTYDAEGDATTVPSAGPSALRRSGSRGRSLPRRNRTNSAPVFRKKIHGVPAYKLARQPKEVVLQPVRGDIKEFEILGVERDRARFHARVASGT
jgi:tRNA pseudouridine55 synthase